MKVAARPCAGGEQHEERRRRLRLGHERYSHAGGAEEAGGASLHPQREERLAWTAGWKCKDVGVRMKEMSVRSKPKCTAES